MINPEGPVRVLLLNPEMPESFWTFREGCRYGGAKVMHPPLGLITVAALLPPHWELRLVDLDVQPHPPIDWQWPDLVMLTGMLIQRPRLLELIREATGRGKTVVVGGPYPTSLPREVLDAGADFLIRGEGENTIPLFLEALAQGRTAGVVEAPDKPDLALSPIPRFDLLRLHDYSCMPIQTSRGCPFDCDFCDVISLYGRKVRHKTVAQVIAELDAVYQLGWRKNVFFCDDNFIGNKKFTRALLAALIPWMAARGEPFSFWTQTSIDLGQDLELIDLLTRANFATVFIGLETPDEDILSSTRKFQNIRNPLAASVRAIMANGLGMIGSFIMGFDGERPGAGDRISAFVEAANIPLVMLNLLTPLPNTRLWQRLEQEGRLRDLPPQDCIGLRPIYQPQRPEAELLGEYRRLWDDLYTPSRFLARAYRYFLAMRPTRAALSNGPQRQPRPHGHSGNLAGFRERWRHLPHFVRLCWRLGVLADCRGQYWRQLFGLYRRNPSRLVKYLNCIGLGEDLFRLRDAVQHDQTIGGCT